MCDVNEGLGQRSFFGTLNLGLKITSFDGLVLLRDNNAILGINTCICITEDKSKSQWSLMVFEDGIGFFLPARITEKDLILINRVSRCLSDITVYVHAPPHLDCSIAISLQQCVLLKLPVKIKSYTERHLCMCARNFTKLHYTLHGMGTTGPFYYTAIRYIDMVTLLIYTQSVLIHHRWIPGVEYRV